LHGNAPVGDDPGVGNASIRLDYGFDLTQRGASIALVEVTVVTLLVFVERAVAAKRGGCSAVLIARRGAGWLAIFSSSVVDDSIAAHLADAR
jgi:hypothetical protein